VGACYEVGDYGDHRINNYVYKNVFVCSHHYHAFRSSFRCINRTAASTELDHFKGRSDLNFPLWNPHRNPTQVIHSPTLNPMNAEHTQATIAQANGVMSYLPCDLNHASCTNAAMATMAAAYAPTTTYAINANAAHVMTVVAILLASFILMSIRLVSWRDTFAYLRIPRMRPIKWPSCIITPDDMAALLASLDNAIMAWLANRLQRAVDELIPIATMRLDVICHSGGNYKPTRTTYLAQWDSRQLR
jgi:hypothetical protein